MNFAQFLHVQNDAMNSGCATQTVLSGLKRFRVVEPKIPNNHCRGRSSNSNAPGERSGHRMLCDRNYVYVFGGFCRIPDLGSQLMQEVWRFNVLTDEWELLNVEESNFPLQMASFALCSTECEHLTHAFLFGGTAVPFGFRSSNKVTVLKRVSDDRFVWQQQRTIGNEPVEEYGSSMLYHDGLIYVIGGTTGHFYNLEVRTLRPVWEKAKASDDGNHASTSQEPDHWEWDLVHEGVELRGRYRHEAIVVGHYIVILGGGDPMWASDFVSLVAFDTRKKKFMSVATHPDDEHGYPLPRLCHACVKYGSKIYVIGGCSEKKEDVEHDWPDVYDDIWELDTVTWKWGKMLAKLHMPTCFHSAVVTQDGCIYVFGGVVNGAFTRRTNVLQRLWLEPPSLQLLASRAVLDARPTILEGTSGSGGLVVGRPLDLMRLAMAAEAAASDGVSATASSSWILNSMLRLVWRNSNRIG